MTAKAEAEFKITNWDERPYRQEPGERMLTRASITKTYQGDIQGEASLEYLMMYRENESASFVGHERIKGQLAGRSGSFVLQHIGTYDDGVAKASLTVIPGSGTGELSGLIGEGEFEAGHAESHPLSLNYDFDGQAAQGNTTNLSES
jgi:hypothetical protein